ncbi:MAG: type II toxin-antitoxin system HicA family toxin [Chloroflexi bacterium]|nr:type II toxin-antitoxin system HicA family toxin [Chloroflexota bacterium]
MTKLRLVAYRQLRKVAETTGFEWQRCEGSHNTFMNTDGRIVVIPDHGSQVIVRPLLRKILRDLGLDVGTYHRILDKL